MRNAPHRLRFRRHLSVRIAHKTLRLLCCLGPIDHPPTRQLVSLWEMPTVESQDGAVAYFAMTGRLNRTSHFDLMCRLSSG